MKLYFQYFIIHMKSQMEYKTSFLLTLLGQFLSSFNAVLGIYFLFARFHRVESFEYKEVLLCFAIVMMAFALAECFARGFDTFPTMIGNGEFDRILLRPCNIILQVLSSKMEFTRIGRMIQSVVIFVYVIPTSQIDWTLDKIFTVIFMIVSGTIVFTGLFILSAGLCFFTIEGLEVMNIFTDGGREFATYPLSVYGTEVLKFFTYIVPWARKAGK